MQRETWRPYNGAAPAVTPLTPFAPLLTERAPRVKYPARILFQELRQQQHAGSYETIKRLVQPPCADSLRAQVSTTAVEMRWAALSCPLK